MDRALFALLIGMAVSTVLGCSSDDQREDPNFDAFALDIVTGIDATDFNGQAIGRSGNPNDYGQLIVYPNPALTAQTLQVLGSEIDAMWLIQATINKSFTDTNFPLEFSSFIGYDTLTLSSVAVDRIGTVGAVSASSIRLDTRALAVGYYRVIAFDTSGIQHARSVYIDPENSYPDVLEKVIEDWEE